MHYRNGREAKNGDRIVSLEGGKVVRVGELADALPGNDYCNGKIIPIPSEDTACLCDCLHVDDLAAILAEKGLDKRPDGK
jgi:ABC-type proline/glycine betaine transport system ATPase subunit